MRDYALQMHVRADGQVQIDVSVPAEMHRGARAKRQQVAAAAAAASAARAQAARGNRIAAATPTAGEGGGGAGGGGERGGKGGGGKGGASSASDLDDEAQRSPGALSVEAEAAAAAAAEAEAQAAWAAAAEAEELEASREAISGAGEAISGEPVEERLRLLRLVARHAGISLFVHGAEMCHVSLVQAPEHLPLPPPPVLNNVPEGGVAPRGAADPNSLGADAAPGPLGGGSEPLDQVGPGHSSLEEMLNLAAESAAPVGSPLVGVAEAVAAWDPDQRSRNASDSSSTALPPDYTVTAPGTGGAGGGGGGGGDASSDSTAPHRSPPGARVFEVAAQPKTKISVAEAMSVVLHESQRRSAPWRPWSSDDLTQRLLADEAPPGTFSEDSTGGGAHHHRRLYPPAAGWPALSAVPLPAGSSGWLGAEWTRPVPAHEEGWLYAPTWRGPYTATATAITFVRRRRWTRFAQAPQEPPAAAPAKTKTARFDPSVLDHTCGADAEGRASTFGQRSTLADALSPARYDSRESRK